MLSTNTIITCLIAHIDHGKTTLMDSLLASESVISKTSAGELRALDTRIDEQQRGITMKLNAITLSRKNQYIIIDTPGHIDFEHLVQKSSILVDNFLLLIDVSEGITPRTYSLINHINGRYSVLVLNKIDRVWDRSFDEICICVSDMINRINGLMGTEVFSWQKKNVIIACSKLCLGVNYNVFETIIGPGKSSRNTIKNSLKFILLLKKKINDNDVENILKKYNIKYKGQKHIFSKVLSLSDSILSSIDNYILTKDEVSKSMAETIINKNACIFGIPFEFYLNELTPLNPSKDTSSLKGITSFCVLTEQTKISKENLLFVTRIFRGTIKKGSKVFSCTKNSSKECIVEKIFLFGINKLKEVHEICGSSLVCIKSDFLKNSVISDKPEILSFCLEEKKPFFKAKLILNDDSQRKALKSTISVLSFIDSPIKVKLNKYNEFEFLCQGKVQFEKIVKDLELLGFDFTVSDFGQIFAEAPKENARREFCFESCTITVEIGSSELLENEIYVSGNESFLSSVLNFYLKNGPLIGEEIVFSKFNIITEGLINSFSLVKKCINTTFLDASPSIIAFYYACTSYISKEYLGITYSTLHKFDFIMISDEFDPSSQFFKIQCLIPQMYYSDFVEEIKIRTKGTIYLDFVEHGFHKSFDSSFDEFIENIRLKKGLFVEQKLVDDPEKQRTLKK